MSIIKYIMIFISGILIATVVIILVFLPTFSVYNSSNYDIVDLLSINVGILQGFIAIIGIGIVVAAYFNFTTIKNKLTETDDKLKDIQKIIDEHE